MQPWVESHKDWISLVTAHLLDIKKRSLQDFLNEWLHGAFPLDEAGILIVTWAYKVHVAMFFNDSYWTTTAVTDLNKCKIFLLYCGSLVFKDSRRVTVAEYTERCRLYSQLDRYYKKMETNKRKAKKIRCDSPVYSRNAIPTDSESESENIMPQEQSAKLSDEESSSNQGKGHDAEPDNIMQDTPAEKQENIMRPDSNDTNGSVANKDDVDLEKIMEDSDSPEKQEDSDSTTKQSDNKSSSSSTSLSSSSSEDTSSKESSFICSTATCGEVYDSAAVLRAHEHKHRGIHHSDGRIHCDYLRCQKNYGTKRALQRHKKNAHENPGKVFYCTERTSEGKDCIKSYPTQQQLDQHVQGIHREDFISYCGKSFTWPLDRHKHQRECTKCKCLMQ